MGGSVEDCRVRIGSSVLGFWSAAVYGWVGQSHKLCAAVGVAKYATGYSPCLNFNVLIELGNSGKR